MKVLVAEDDLVSRHRLETLLRTWGYSVTTAVDGAEALRMLDEPDHPRLMVLDRMMPNLDGLAVCRAIRSSGTEPYIYIVLLTGHDRQEDIIEGFAAGADDYIIKPFEVQELKARVNTGARIVTLQEELIAAREALRHESMHDSLTRVLNRPALFQMFEREVTLARRQKTPLSLIMADVDHFKSINDQYGHLVGDAVLRETARRLRASLRASDHIGRYGGEEFVIVAPGCAMPEATSLASRCCEAVALEPISVGRGYLTLTMSVGVAATGNMDEADLLLRAADEALYKAKEGGRNRVIAGSFSLGQESELMA